VTTPNPRAGGEAEEIAEAGEGQREMLLPISGKKAVAAKENRQGNAQQAPKKARSRHERRPVPERPDDAQPELENPRSFPTAPIRPSIGRRRLQCGWSHLPRDFR